MKNTIIYNLPVYPHLKKWLLKHLYPDHIPGQPIKIEEDSVLGKHIISILIDKRSIKKGIGLSSFEFTDTLPICLSNTLANRSPALHKLCLLNLEFKKQFTYSMFQWVIAQKHVGTSAKRAIENFIAFYDLEDDYSFDTAHRAWNRYINREYQKEKSLRAARKEQMRLKTQEPSS